MSVRDVGWTLGKVAMLLTTVVAGALIFCAIWMVTYSGSFLTQFPITIYGRWLRRASPAVALGAAGCAGLMRGVAVRHSRSAGG